jgi:hypothetical protein
VNDQNEDKEDYFLLATVGFNDGQYDGVPCKVYLPKRVIGKVRIVLKPSKEQCQKIFQSFRGSLYAELKGFDGKTQNVIDAPKVYFTRSSTRHWGKELSESIIFVDPGDISFAKVIRNPQEGDRGHIVLWLSQNRMLSPDITQQSSYDGSVTMGRVRQITVHLDSESRLLFDYHYRSRTDDSGTFTQWADLVAMFEGESPFLDNASISVHLMPKVDDLLLIASLGSRTRTACVGWEAAETDRITHYYRRNISIPSGYKEPSFQDGLVSLRDFQEFLSVAHSTFVQLPNKQPIREAIVSVVPGRERRLEEDFLSAFAGLEELILDYRRREGLEYILDEQSFKQVRGHLKKAISKFDKLALTKDQRSWIYAKLAELNRVPLQVAFDEFCKVHSVELADLWPVFTAPRDGIGLSDIRNRMLHGQSLSVEAQREVSVATECLRWTVERMLLSLLRWPVDRSEIARASVKHHSTALRELDEWRSRLSDLCGECRQPRGR